VASPSRHLHKPIRAPHNPRRARITRIGKWKKYLHKLTQPQTRVKAGAIVIFLVETVGGLGEQACHPALLEVAFGSVMRSFQPKRKRSFRKKPAFAPALRGGQKGPLEESPAPRVHREAERLLSDIGRPEPVPFIPDPFQKEAVDRIGRGDVLVSAPTGSGKTWIALEATKEFLSRGCRIWYATPLKALSNAKNEEFGEALGRDKVGILTGDRKENADAPVIVGTTEILRNQLYDAMQAGVDIGVHLVILDEAHYLGDIDRGVVWEEVLIYLPARVRLLMLSATISNAASVAGWLTHIRNKECSVVYSEIRPVPLHVLFRTPRGELTPFSRGKHLFPKVATYAKEEKGKKRSLHARPQDINGIVITLREFNLLPAIIFLKSRSDCDNALQTLLPAPLRPEEGSFAEAVKDQLAPYPELMHHRQLNRLLHCRAGSHHAGQLPGWRLLIEKMMVLGHLEVIFSTSTVAAGVNFPARTVVLMQSDRFNGRTFVDMTATDLHQMTGRAGRRGMDNAGFTLVVPGKFLNVGLVKDLLSSEPEPLQSRIAVNFSMTLNLLLSHDPDGVRKLLALSFASFRENPRHAARVHSRLLKEFQRHLKVLKELNYLDESGVPTYDGRWAAQLRLDHPLLIAELIRQGEFNGLDPRELAALIAPFVLDKDKEILISREIWERTRPLWKRFRRMMQKLQPLAQFLVARGFDVPVIMFWPAASVFLWAGEVDWTELTANIGADEGDLAMLILRTADHLRQLLSLESEQPELSRTAREAIELLVRSPLT
jgi:superfamily II RNA helicase